MISPLTLKEIRGFLERSHNPLFLFDDDNDALCSFLLLREFIGRGDGLQIKTNPDLNESFLKVIKKYDADTIFVLDKPLVSQDFIDGVNVPIVWIDHHEPVFMNGVKYYNPKLDGSEDHSSTTYWCYKAVGGKVWVAAVGAVSDWTLPDYFTQFKQEYPDLVNNEIKPDAVLYETALGRLCKIFSLLNKGSHKEVQNSIDLLLKIKTPYEILNEESSYGKDLMKKVRKPEKKYNELVDKAMKTKKDGPLLLFCYIADDTSFTSDLSNELLYRNPRSFIIVAREKEGTLVMSLRSDIFEVLPILKKALGRINGGYGGGHMKACGAGVPKEEFDIFLN